MRDTLREDRTAALEKYSSPLYKIIVGSQQVFLFLIVALVAVFMLAPFAWMVITSIKPKAEIFQQQPNSILPPDTMNKTASQGEEISA